MATTVSIKKYATLTLWWNPQLNEIDDSEYKFTSVFSNKLYYWNTFKGTNLI